MTPGLNASILNNIMCPRVYDGSGGIIKLAFMTCGVVALKDLTTPNCPMADLLKALHRLLGKRYQLPQDLPSASPAPDRMQSEAEHALEDKALIGAGEFHRSGRVAR